MLAASTMMGPGTRVAAGRVAGLARFIAGWISWAAGKRGLASGGLAAPRDHSGLVRLP